MAPEQSAAGRYNQLEAVRSIYLQRARDSAALTIPSLLPPEGSSGSTKLPTPYQGTGARGVNNLASKLLLALFPPNSPFFRMMVDDFTMEKVTAQKGMRAEVEKALSKVERAVMTTIEQTAIRVPAFEALKQLVVSGNVLCFLPNGGGMRVFRLDRYVVLRDPMGTVLEIVVKEDVSPLALPKELQEHIKSSPGPTGHGAGDPAKTVALYTHIVREADRWTIRQEVAGKTVDGSDGTYPLDKSPWIVLRWTKIDGEDYGRGYVEEYIGDLKSLEALTQAIVEGAAASAKLLFLVNPNGTTNAKQVAQAKNGAIIAGNKEDVSVLQADKFADFQVAFKTIEQVEGRLAFSFMLNAAVQRDGERVTAEEIRFMAGELEDALGGVYSILSQEFQLPLVNRLLLQMENAGRLPPLPKDLVKPTITTGLEALGRGHDLNKLAQFLQMLQPLGPEVIAQYMNVGDYITRSGTSLGIDMDGLVRSEEEVAQAQQQAQAAEMVNRLGPKGMDIVRDQMKPQEGNAPQAQGSPNG